MVVVTSLEAGVKQYWWLTPRQERWGTRAVDTALYRSLRGRESVESPCNTWGPLLQLQEIK